MGRANKLYIRNGGGNLTIKDSLISIFKGNPKSFSDPLWFVATLFFVKIVDYGSCLLYNKSKLLFYITILFCLGVVLNHFYEIIPLQYSFVKIFMAWPYFLVGKLFKQYEHKINDKPLHIQYVLILLGLVMPLVGIYINGMVDLYLGMFGRSVLLYYIVSVLSSVGIICFMKNIAGNYKVITVLSNGTLLILAFHKYILAFLSQFNYSFPHRLIIAAMCLLFFYFPIILAYKYCPIIIGKYKK